MRLRALVFAVLLLFAAPSWGAVVFDAETDSACASCTSLDFSCSPSGSDRLLIANAGLKESAGSSVSGMTFNGVSLTDVDSIDAGTVVADMWHLVAPATGPNTLSTAISGSAAVELHVACLSFTGVDQTTPLGTPTSATGSSTAPLITVTSATGELVVDGIALDHNGTLTVGSGQTERHNNIGPAGWNKYGGSTEPGASPNVVMNWSNANSVSWASIGVSIKPAGAASASPRRFLLLGVGP